MDTLDDFHTMDSELRSIRVDDDVPKLQPLRLDAMFLRAHRWKVSAPQLVTLFNSLDQHRELCKLVRSLDVRFFPLATRDTERSALDEQVQSAVGSMTNLQNLVWTRDKSLKPALVERISALTHLRSLEISGHSYRYYDAKVLGRLEALEDLRIMMPDSSFRDAILGIVKALDSRPAGGLKGLAIVCRSSPLVDDAMLKDLAPLLRGLKRLTLWGCTRVTRSGVFEILREAEDLQELSLDALPHSGLTDLSGSPESPALSTLSLSFTCPHKTPTHPHLTVDDVPTFPSTPSLQSLVLTLSADRAFIPQGGLAKLKSQIDFSALRRLSILNLFISTCTLSEIIVSAPKLEELYISVNGRSTVMECDELRGSGVRILHVNAPERWGPTPDDLNGLARGMPRLEQVGTGNRVYEVVRRYEEEEHVVELSRWSRTTTPGYFQVWRG